MLRDRRRWCGDTDDQPALTSGHSTAIRAIGSQSLLAVECADISFTSTMAVLSSIKPGAAGLCSEEIDDAALAVDRERDSAHDPAWPAPDPGRDLLSQGACRALTMRSNSPPRISARLPG